MSDVAVGLDVGTGAARAVAIDGEGTMLGTAWAPYPGVEKWPVGHADAHAWRSACLDALQILADRLSLSGPTAMAIGGQSPTTVDRERGTAITIRHPAGSDLDSPARQQAQRAVLDQEAGGGVAPRQLWDWLILSLGGGDAQGRWPGDPLLQDFGERICTGEVVGHASGERGLPRGTPLVSGAQDAYLSFWAGGVDYPGQAMDPGGRTGGLAVAVPAGFNAGGLWSFASAARGVEIAGGPVNAHGIALEWLAAVVNRPLDDLIAAAAAVPAGARGILFLPYLEGERAPRWDGELRGVFAGLDAKVSAAELARAVLEGTACGLGHLARQLREAGAHLDSAVFAGTPANSELWCRIKAAVMNVRAYTPEEPDLAAYGAALAAGAGMGWWPRPGDGESGAWPHPPMRRLPSLETGVYADLLERFVAAGDLAQKHPRVFGGAPTATAKRMEN